MGRGWIFGYATRIKDTFKKSTRSLPFICRFTTSFAPLGQYVPKSSHGGSPLQCPVGRMSGSRTKKWPVRTWNPPRVWLLETKSHKLYGMIDLWENSREKHTSKNTEYQQKTYLFWGTLLLTIAKNITWDAKDSLVFVLSLARQLAPWAARTWRFCFSSVFCKIFRNLKNQSQDHLP